MSSFTTITPQTYVEVGAVCAIGGAITSLAFPLNPLKGALIFGLLNLSVFQITAEFLKNKTGLSKSAAATMGLGVYILANVGLLMAVGMPSLLKATLFTAGSFALSMALSQALMTIKPKPANPAV